MRDYEDDDQERDVDPLDDGDQAYDRAKDDHATGDCAGAPRCSWCIREAKERTKQRNVERLAEAKRKRDEAQRAVFATSKTREKQAAQRDLAYWSAEVRRLETLI